MPKTFRDQTSIKNKNKKIASLKHRIENKKQRILFYHQKIKINSPFSETYIFAIDRLKQEIKELKNEILSIQSSASLHQKHKKINYDDACNLISDKIQQYKQNNRTSITIEEIINDTNIESSIIKKVFMQLNREGYISQAINNKSEFKWRASIYYIL